MSFEEFTTKYAPHMRAEKTHDYRDDLRVMMAGTIFLIFLIMMQPFIFRVWDWSVASRPFVFATVEIFQDPRHNRPMIMYDADANQAVTGTWTATIHDAQDDARVYTRKGKGNYSNQEDIPRLWRWAAFFDNGQDTPSVPDYEFYICVTYVVQANDSGVNDSTPPFCSAPFDPNNPRFLMESEFFEVEK